MNANTELFTDKVIESLNEQLSNTDVKTRDGTGTQKLQYIASHHAISEANRIFGFGNWGTEIQMLQQVDKTHYEKPDNYNKGKPKKMVSVSYLCHLKLTVGETTHEDAGFGNGVAGDTPYGLNSCIELATKESVSDALKRCLRYYGNKFGNSLYDKDGVGSVSPDDIALAKPITSDQLDSLLALYPDRGISDEWVITALKAEGYPDDDLTGMRQDWFDLAYRLTESYKLDEIKKANYEESVNKSIKLMNESVNNNMLKATFMEAYKKAEEQGDKEMMIRIIKDKDRLKEGFDK